MERAIILEMGVATRDDMTAAECVVCWGEGGVVWGCPENLPMTDVQAMDGWIEMRDGVSAEAGCDKWMV